MNIEELFIEEYKALKDENEKLKSQNGEFGYLKQPSNIAGVEDTHTVAIAVKYSVCSYYSMFDHESASSMTIDELTKLKNLSDDELVKWGLSHKTGRYFQNFIDREEKNFPTILKVTKQTSEVVNYFYDYSDCLHLICPDDEIELGEWTLIAKEEFLVKLAADSFRDNLERRIKRLSDD